jgi:hypothetical protein
LTATRAGRRRLFQAGTAVGVGTLLTRGVDAVIAEACQQRVSKCNRNRQC